MRYLKKALAVTSLAIAGLAFGSDGTVFAQKAVLLTDESTTCEIFAHFSLDVPSECLETALSGATGGQRTRGIVINRDVEEELESPSVATATQPTASPAISNDFNVAYEIQFAFDSSYLSGSARSRLDQMASVLNNELMKDKVVLIEGHADSKGSTDYNLKLSERRAEAVAQYLVERHGIESRRFVLRAKGESEPFDREDPTAAVNRRVEFQNLSDLASIR